MSNGKIPQEKIPDFFELSEMEGTIISEDGVFDESHIPKIIVGREDHVREIENCLLPLKNNKTGKNLYLHGPPGTGKTLSAKHVLKKHFDKNSIFISCWRNRTSHKIMYALLRKLGFLVHGRESTSELVKRLEESEKRSLVCLDEVDQLKDSNVLYDLSRNSKGLVLISNLPYSEFRLDQRVKSRLFLHDIEFLPYQKDDVFTILKDRARKGFHGRTVGDEILRETSSCCGGDARMAIQMIRSAAREAEMNNEDSITIERIRASTGAPRKYRLSYLIGKLTDPQRVLYEILTERKKIYSGDLFREYCKRSTDKITDRTYRNYMKRIVWLGLAREINSGRWKKYEIIS